MPRSVSAIRLRIGERNVLILWWDSHGAHSQSASGNCDRRPQTDGDAAAAADAGPLEYSAVPHLAPSYRSPLGCVFLSWFGLPDVLKTFRRLSGRRLRRRDVHDAFPTSPAPRDLRGAAPVLHERSAETWHVKRSGRSEVDGPRREARHRG